MIIVRRALSELGAITDSQSGVVSAALIVSLIGHPTSVLRSLTAGVDSFFCALLTISIPLEKSPTVVENKLNPRQPRLSTQRINVLDHQ